MIFSHCSKQKFKRNLSFGINVIENCRYLKLREAFPNRETIKNIALNVIINYKKIFQLVVIVNLGGRGVK